jgi:hypothetical protein
MKLFAGRETDLADRAVLWPQCAFPSVESAADAFRAAYPHLPDDPHLAGFIRTLAEGRA